MKSFSDAAMAEIVKGRAVTAGAVEILCTPPVHVWSGNGVVSFGGEDYVGLGGRGLVRMVGGAVGDVAEKFTLILSGIDPAALELLDAADLKNATVTVHQLIYDSSGTQLLDYHVFRRGRVDRVSTEDVPGGEAKIVLDVEGLSRGLKRRGGRMRSDADQRLIDASDGGMKRVSYAPQKQLNWGGKPPSSAGQALPYAANWGKSYNDPDGGVLPRP